MAKSHSNQPALIPAVAYLRMSSDQQDKSIASQRQEIARYAERRGYKIIREYADEGISGARDDRAGFQLLIADAAERRDFAVVLVWDQDRFSRFDPMQANYYWFLLRQAGVTIDTAANGPLDLEGLGGWLSASVIQHGKAQFLKDLSKNSLRGRIRKAGEGKYTGSRAPYGYSLADAGELVIGEAQQVETVRWLFDCYANTGMSLYTMAAELNQRGVPSPSGKQWQSSTIRGILGRRDYIGEATVFKFARGKFHSARHGNEIAPHNGKRLLKDSSEWVAIPCPPIIERSLWEKAQQARVSKRRCTTPKKSGGDALLAGLVRCEHCGQPMYATEQHRKGSKKRVYICSTYMEQGNAGCHRNMMDEAPLRTCIIELLGQVANSPATRDRLRKAIERLTTKSRSPVSQEATAKRLAALDKEIKEAVAELKRTPADLYDLAVAHVRELRTQQAVLAAKAAPQPAPRLDAIEKALGLLADLPTTITKVKPATARDVLRQFVDGISLRFDHTQHGKITRSKFTAGTLRLKSIGVAQSQVPDLLLLPDIGESLARRIVDERAANGAFRDHDDLLRVRGIGPKTLERIKPYLRPMPRMDATAGK